MFTLKSVLEADVGKSKTANFTPAPLGAGRVSVSVPAQKPQMMIEKTDDRKTDGRENNDREKHS